MRTRTKLGMNMAFFAIVLFGAGCSSSTTTTGTTNTTTGSGNAVTISGQAFSPSSLTVSKGTAVTWTNNDSLAHTVTGDNGGPASGQLAAGQTYSYTFDTAGTFSYHCTNHPDMMGTVTVQ